jgi:hypothetical protein
MPMTEEFRLTPIEVASALWTRLSAHLNERLQVLREKNDNTLDEQQTARIRGEIAEIKRLLALGQPETKY